MFAKFSAVADDVYSREVFYLRKCSRHLVQTVELGIDHGPLVGRLQAADQGLGVVDACINKVVVLSGHDVAWCGLTAVN